MADPTTTIKTLNQRATRDTGRVSRVLPTASIHIPMPKVLPPKPLSPAQTESTKQKS